jgi:glyoxylase-like metal-dependent hydrolase (beta-lactamase superfamily II)
MTRPLALGGLLLCGSLSLSVAAWQQPPQPPAGSIQVEQLQDNLYVARGGGGNTSLFITATGVIVVDTKNPGWGQPLLDTIKTLTRKPVTMIVNTHTHGDHVSGNVEFPATVDVVAHENTRTYMQAMRPASWMEPEAGGAPPNLFTQHQGRNLPTRTFRDTMTIGSGADRIELRYFGRAHTGGDAMVWFPSARVLHMADAFGSKALPGMDANNGGSGVEYAATLTRAAEFADQVNVATIVNGHRATTSSRAELREYIEFITDFVKRVQDARKAGVSSEQFAREWKTPARFAGYETVPALRVKNNADLIYAESANAR